MVQNQRVAHKKRTSSIVLSADTGVLLPPPTSPLTAAAAAGAGDCVVGLGVSTYAVVTVATCILAEREPPNEQPNERYRLLKRPDYHKSHNAFSFIVVIDAELKSNGIAN